MPVVANAGQRAPGRARGVGSTPGCPASPIRSPPPPLHDPTLPHDRAEASTALSPRSGPVSCTPRASPAFPAKGERDRAVLRPFLQGIVNPSPCASPFEPKPTSAMRTSSTNRARALKTACFRPQHSTTDAIDHISRRSPQHHPECTASLPNPRRSKPRAPSPSPGYKTHWTGQNLPLDAILPPSPLHPENHTDEAHPFLGLLSSRNVAGAGVDDEGFGHCRPSPSALSLQLSLLHLDLDLTLHPISSLAARGRRHLRRSPRTIADEHGHTPPRAPLPASFGRGGVFRETAAALQQPQPPLTPLGEPRLIFLVARARVLPSPRREGDDGSPPSISVLIGRAATPDTDSAPRAADRRAPLPSGLNPPLPRAGAGLGRPSSDLAEPLQIWPVSYYFQKTAVQNCLNLLD
jgi:hypothetical protein